MAQTRQNVPEILLEWGMPPDVIQAFIDDDICIGSMLLLKPKDIESLIKKRGPRLVFESKLELLKQQQSIGTCSLHGDSGDSSSGSTSESSDQALNKSQSADKSSSPSAALSIKEDEPSVNEVHAVLKTTAEGVTILCYFNKFKKLDSRSRDELSLRVIYEELKNNYNNRISLKRYQDLAKQISILFPTEDELTYCLVSKSQTKCNSNKSKIKTRTVVSGKLRHTFYNVRRKFIQVGLISKKSVLDELLSDEGIDDADPLEDDNVIWLKDHITPWATVISKWEKTYELRRTMLRSLTYDEYFQYFACLQSNAGWELLVQDCVTQYPVTKNRLLVDWPTFLEYAKEQLLENRLFDSELLTDVPPSQSATEILCHLSQLFTVRNLPKKKKGKKSDVWRPTRAEVQQSFLSLVSDIKQIDDIVNSRLQVLQKYGYSLQPFPAIVGSSSCISQCLIVFGTCRWVVPSPLEAVDICFKIFFALNCDFPPESRMIWLFVQKVVYKLDTKNDYLNDAPLRSYLASHLKTFANFVKNS